LIAIAAGIAGFAVGTLPIWIFNIQTNGYTFGWFAAATGGEPVNRLEVLWAWITGDLPRGAGLVHPWGEPVFVLGLALGLVLAGAWLWAIVARRSWRLRPLDAVLLLLLAIPIAFTASGFGQPALNPYGIDATGRYAPPIWGALAVVLGAALAALWSYRRAAAIGVAALVIAINLSSVGSANRVLAFQTPYWFKLPVDSTELLDVLAEERIEHIWINHWAGLPLMFDARARGQRLWAYDWYDYDVGGVDRFPEYRPLIESAARPAFVLVTDEWEPELQRRFDEMGVTYWKRVAWPYVILAPESRKVHPSEIVGAIDERY
jgi:hypothetical protein